MLFNSASFLVFIVVVFSLYAALRRSGARKWLLLLASYLFYAHWDWRYVSLLAFSTGVDYVVGRHMHACTTAGRRRLWLLASLATNLGLLAVFKYGNFLLENLALFVPALAFDEPLLPGEIPIGISFYTFQTLSYSLDIYLRRTTPCRSPLDFALFVSFFAQLVAGPIVRSTEFLPQIERMPNPRAAEVSAGIQRFVWGLFKKVVLADHAALLVDRVFADPGTFDALFLWAAMYAFALQIYLDFSAYTDMALGIGRAFGLKLPENFDAPYSSRSITEFWRRWHMSLSRWLRDYLYIPLGGSRHGRARTYVSLAATMLLGGLWHGAAWSFVLWGAFHGILLALERYFGFLRGSEATSGGLARLVRRLWTFHLVCFGWILFRGESLASIGVYLTRMVRAWSWPEGDASVALAWTAATAAIFLAQLVGRQRDLRARAWERAPAALQGFGLALLVLLVSLYHVDENAFLYFQF